MARNRSIATLRWVSRQSGEKIHVMADQRIVYFNDLFSSEPFSLVMLVCSTTLFTVQVTPFVEMIIKYVRVV